MPYYAFDNQPFDIALEERPHLPSGGACPPVWISEPNPPMKVLVVSYAFPPYNSIGAVRLGKITKYLGELGWDIRVVSAKDQPFSPTLPTSLRPDRVRYTSSIEVDRLARFATRGEGSSTTTSTASPNHFKRLLKQAYTNLLFIPDSSIGWYPFAVAEGMRVAGKWRPDVIYASGPPFTSLMVAARLARKLRVPWVAELRDLWSSSSYYPWSRIRQRIDRTIEYRALSSASGFVGATAAISRELQAVYGKPSETVLGGFEPLSPDLLKTKADEDARSSSTEHANTYDGRPLRIVYTGTIYRDKRDPGLLFEALRELPRGSVLVDFYGRHLEPVHAAIREYDLAGVVTVHGNVSYSDALRAQASADLLLLLLWLDPGDDGSIPAKVYEYLSARRPILAIGLESSEASKLIRETRVGHVYQSKDQLVDALRARSEELRLSGSIMPPEYDRVEALSSREQTRKLSRLLEEIAH